MGLMNPNIFHGSLTQVQGFLLIMMRVSPILFMMPLFNARNLPNLLKVSLALTVSLVLWPVAPLDASLFPADPCGFMFLLISELMIGLLLGLSVQLVFGGLQLAGELMGVQMGLSMASIVDPQSGGNSTVIAQFHYLLGLLIFLSIDGHHWFFRALIRSFQLLSPGEFVPKAGLYRHLLGLSGRMFLIALQIAAPVMAILFFIQVALGILARAVPQVNILMSSFPLTISLGLVFLGLSLDLLWPYLKNLFEESGQGLVMILLPLMKQ
jgi:flagellar biosynthetic protein FliR